MNVKFRRGNNVTKWGLLFYLAMASTVTAKEKVMNNSIIDDRSTADLYANTGTQWRLVTDQVMGGVSNGELALDNYLGRKCLRMRGDVSTENNGGFVQMALDLTGNDVFDASAYSGVELAIAGNNEEYNVHFRTDGLWFPWQSYRASFNVTEQWQTIRIAFAELRPYKTTQTFTQNKLKRIGIVAIGREFQADLCLAGIRFY